MAYQRIRQPKLSDVIEQELERLIVEGTLSPGQQLPPERELAKQFDVSRPSVREAIQRLEAKRLLTRRQGGGTFVSENIWKSFSDPLLNLLSSHSETQLDLLESRHAMEGISAYFAALRGTEEDFARIQGCLERISKEQANNDIEAESAEVMQFLIAITEAAHNVVLLHIVRSLAPLLEQNILQIEQNILQNFKLLRRRPEAVEKVSKHRANIVDAIVSGQPEKAREMSHSHLAYIEETLLDLTREESRRERSLRRIQQGNNS
ncbi:pyruvate dehydrogenase complex transcriptional repressor PdhR [Vibrio parahaemolyticus]|uniref:pyruvate dehydrogenase complex transcriptional repressor PdhR n=8 Tax=Vibrio parahaemolyticus TaxID=670 RepID=UPI0005A5DC6E|nr:pyruvate dehydrogenase complex transcriptional repressor PdhR [Vibrio parahaemolyticus]AMG06538.1 pyruvate dehydrogenase complex transcriptional repressor PdhR [Vibrio parahaemolyticus]EGR0428149.1 pyruvate dehydrogenase complex transcriptional repressor PdhR [Vibrio parahaemolyticus]KKI08146.1 transcriptional regulator PdhR [Vibrio parahaemolyticus]MBY7692832.1 pyruvate dehydrogenase complex transcriptional repressor PdhR [Vibrio parahaemolyticus]OOE31345.1 transcriptional regulator PdhR [